MPTLQIALQDHELRVLLDRATLNPAVEHDLGLAVRDGVERIRARAVRNVSGYPVSVAGNAFRVRVRTGALKGALESQWPYNGTLTGRVFVNGSHMSEEQTPDGRRRAVPVSRYAAAIEYGHGEIDLKKTMPGKIVPFYGARAQKARGPYAATGIRKIPLEDGAGKPLYSSTRMNRALAKKGKRPMYFQRKPVKGGSAYFIAFRRVGNEGWIIPAARPRPFLQAALQGAVPEIKTLVAGRLRDALKA